MERMIEILTPRLLLRTPTQDDAQMIVDAMKPVWRELQLWMSWAHDGADTVESIRKNYIAEAVENHWIIGLCRDTGQFVIATGMTPVSEMMGEYEAGYWVAKDFLGKGYATEAANAAIRYGFDVLDARLVSINHYEGNGPSRRIIEKLGFTPVGVRKKAKERCLDGTPLDIHDYIMTDPAVLPPLEWSIS